MTVGSLSQSKQFSCYISSPIVCMMDRRHHHKSDLGSGATELGLNLRERKRGSGERPWLWFWIVTPSNWRGTWGSGHSPLVVVALSKSSINENHCLFHADTKFIPVKKIGLRAIIDLSTQRHIKQGRICKSKEKKKVPMKIVQVNSWARVKAQGIMKNVANATHISCK